MLLPLRGKANPYFKPAITPTVIIEAYLEKVNMRHDDANQQLPLYSSYDNVPPFMQS